MIVSWRLFLVVDDVRWVWMRVRKMVLRWVCCREKIIYMRDFL
jgi:hypothetical protein